MTSDELKRILDKPGYGIAGQIAKAGGEVSHPKPQRHSGRALEQNLPGKAEGFRRTTVIFTGYRVHPLDPDNFAGSVKDLLDGLRHAGLIHGDESWRIRLITDQEKVRSYKMERTEIEIIY